MDQNNNNVVGVVGMNEFFICGIVNEGIQVFLWCLDGMKSEYWVCICGIDLDVFWQVDVEVCWDVIWIVQFDFQVEWVVEIVKVKCCFIVYFVVVWLFDQLCIVDNVEVFFVEVFQIMDFIDVVVFKCVFFFVVGLSSLQFLQSMSLSLI